MLVPTEDLSLPLLLPCRIVIADDHPVLRSGLGALFQQETDMECVGVAQTGDEALALAERQQPDVLVIDLNMPGTPVLAVIRQLREKTPLLRIVVFTMHAIPFAMMETFNAGAHAFLSKDEPFSVLAPIIRRVWKGETGLRSEKLSEHKEFHIAPREREVLYLLASGCAGKEICDQLRISAKTVDMYRTRLLKKFGVSKSTELVRIALDSGMLPMQSKPSTDTSPTMTAKDTHGG